MVEWSQPKPTTKMSTPSHKRLHPMDSNLLLKNWKINYKNWEIGEDVQETPLYSSYFVSLPYMSPTEYDIFSRMKLITLKGMDDKNFETYFQDPYASSTPRESR